MRNAGTQIPETPSGAAGQAGRGRVIVSGGTGFIGRALTRELKDRGYEVLVLTRSLARASAVLPGGILSVEWDGRTSRGWLDVASGARAIVNLAGENIGAGRWTKSKREKITRSRLNAGAAMTEAVDLAAVKPGVLVQASAVGYYGPRRDETLDESEPSGEGFLAGLVRDWEDSTRKVEAHGVRRIIIRSGLVLDRDGGVLPRFLPAFRLFVGGPLGQGNQWMSWIHRADEVAAILFLLEREDLRGVFNLASPHPVSMKEFARTLGKALRRPSCLPVPAFLLRLLFGQMAEETLLSGQRVLPAALLRAGFVFAYGELEAALKSILAR